MKTEKFTHTCSHQVVCGACGEPDLTDCDGEIVLEYELDMPDLLLIQDGAITCEHGHVQTQEWLDAQYPRDLHEMSERAVERHEEAYWDHVNSLIDKARGK